MEDNVSGFRKLLEQERYSEQTIRSYVGAIQHLQKYFEGRKLEELNEADINEFQQEYILKKGYSTSFQNIVINAIKLFYNNVKERKIRLELIRRPRKEKKLPQVLSKDEIQRILNAPKNLKHRMMLFVIYACGLRRSELLDLRIDAIDSQRMLLHIKQAKGKKDRVVPLSESLLGKMREYYKIYKPKQYLFEGQNGGQYSATSLAKILTRATRAAGIRKPVSLHWLRHSYATHLLESGTDLRIIQELLGHNSSRTTEIYTHVSTRSIQHVKSPFDDLGL